MMSRLAALELSVLVMLLLASRPSSALEYTTTDLSVVTGVQLSRATRVTQSGYVVASLWRSDTAVLIKESQVLTRLAPVGGSFPNVYDVAESGWAAGSSLVAGAMRAVIWDPSGEPQVVGPAEFQVRSIADTTNGIVVVGSYRTSGDFHRPAYWDSTGLHYLLTSIGNEYYIGWVSAANSQGVLAGAASSAFDGALAAVTWSGVTAEELPPPPGALPDSGALAISDTGVVVGHASVQIGPLGSEDRAVRWLGGHGDSLYTGFSIAYDVNSSGTIVGSRYSDPHGGQEMYYPLLWYGSVLQPLGQDLMGEFLSINDAGVIAGYYYDSTTDRNRATLWVPVPEPSSLAVLGAGLAVLAAAKRRRR